jgi:hypothetical protein
VTETDLTKLLREKAEFFEYANGGSGISKTELLLIRAADEVERLRGIIAKARSYYGANETSYAVKVLDTVNESDSKETP